ncbi:DUF4386 family protein [Kribbella sp. NPDC048928]|uniref:DUF4386 family protein n=1 Tax=Kribbella sp. NPDC048928 TaxID=3364111 RepID=UPI003711017F
MSRRRIAIAVGILFAVQMITAVFGTSLIQAFVDGNTDRARMTTGVVPNHLLWVYIPTGIGGLILTYLLLTSGLVPRPIAALGFLGYFLLTAGVPLDLLGALDMGAGAGQLLLIPGGLFEFVLMPIWLIAKGFAPARPVHPAQPQPV